VTATWDGQSRQFHQALRVFQLTRFKVKTLLFQDAKKLFN
jgi:hypothetical protein